MPGPKVNQAHFSNAVKVVFIFGLVSLFGDIMYEGMRSANGQYLNTLGVMIGKFAFILGLGEFLAYALRLLAGVISDKSKKYWLFIYLGYGLLIVVPFMGFTSFLPALISFIMLERLGKALRNPAKDTILSHVADGAGGKMGMGFAFGLQEALDQIGAALGPMIFTAVFFITGGRGIAEYQFGYRLMLVPFAILMFVVFMAHRKVTRYNLIEAMDRPSPEEDRIQPIFWLYTFFTFLTTLGFVQFPLIAYHFKYRQILHDAQITLFYSIAMALDAGFALVAGSIYDRIKNKTGNKKAGLLTLLFIPFATAVLPFLTLGMELSIPLLIIGIVCYGAVMGAHETIMRSAIADITTLRKRGTGYGIFNTAYGLALMAGSFLFGYLYDHFGISAIQMVFPAVETLAIALFFVMRQQIKRFPG
jgi:MFS family permease